MKKIELLLPAGNPEAFVAAIEGGANAIYLGLKEFNARGRAKNFTVNQLISMTDYAHKRNVKIYLTLNTVIKNYELQKVLDVLNIVKQIGVDAVIIQDIGVAYLAKKFFPEIALHVSTQAGIHNLKGVNFFANLGFQRIILARELTFNELEYISKNAQAEIEVFIHGALCYSMSGVCLFSSYIGGHSANRGFCRQPCRRIYQTPEKSGYLFNLKDNQQIANIHKFKKLNIASVKIEGRMKSAEYVYKVAKAYRMVLDDDKNLEKAVEILKEDFGREKTEYFFGSDIKNAISTKPYTGLYIGNVIKTDGSSVTFQSNVPIEIGYRIRIMDFSGRDSESIKIKNPIIEKNIIKIESVKNVKKGNKVFLIGKNDVKFNSNIPESNRKISKQNNRRIKAPLVSSKVSKKRLLYVRIANSSWIKKMDFNKFDYLIFNFSKSDWEQFNFELSILKRNINKLIMQLPKFISEDSVDFYKDVIKEAYNAGYRNFMISHISQFDFIKFKNVRIFSSENIYIFNDAAIRFLQDNGISHYVYPYENEYPNLLSGNDRRGIVPLFFYPQLFYSRMPINSIKDEFDDDRQSYKKEVVDGITIVTPKIPVSLFQFKNKLLGKGFSSFLIDLSDINPSQNVFKRLMKSYDRVEVYQPSKTFNFKKGLH